MVIVLVKDFGSSTESVGMQERKRTRAQPPDGWIGESRVVKKRQVGERAVRLKHILEISTKKDANGKKGIGDIGQRMSEESDDLPESQKCSTKVSAEVAKENVEVVKLNESNGVNNGVKQKRRNSKVAELPNKNDEKQEETKDWRDNLTKMKDQIKAVQELPAIEVPKSIQHHKITSVSSPDLTLYSDTSIKSWEIRARYRNMRTEELYQSQLVKKSGYSWREKVPEIQKPLKFSEIRSNAVTDVAFIGSSYVKEKPQEKKQEKVDKSKSPHFMTKIYRIDSSININKIKIIDNLTRNEIPKMTKQEHFTKLQQLEPKPNGTSLGSNCMVLLCTRLLQMKNFSKFRWQFMLCYPGFDLSRDIIKINAAAKTMATIMEMDEIPELEEVKKPDKEDAAAGDIQSKMTGAIAGMQIVKKKNPIEKPPAPAPKILATAGGASDWRSEIKKRERAKQQEKLNAMPLGMPDYREPEKGQVFDWRAKLRDEEKDSDPINKWKKFDTGVKKSIRPPPAKPKPKPSLIPKEDPCTCNVGNCKVHFKFALKSTAKKPESLKVDEPLKRKASIKKKTDSATSSSTSKVKKSESDAKVPKLAQNKSKAPSLSRESSVKPDRQKKEVIKIINFVAIKVTIDEPEPARKRSVKKTKDENMQKPPLPSKPPPPPPKDITPPPSPPPPPKKPTPPPRLPTPPPPKDPSPPPKEPTPPHIIKKLPSPPPSLQKKATSPEPSPLYKRKFFPNPTPSEPYKPKIRDYTPTTVKLKRVDDFEEAPIVRRRHEVEIDVKPLRFSSVQENCIKKALFLGDQYMGGQINSPDTNINMSTTSQINKNSTDDSKLQNYECDFDKSPSIKIEEANVNHNCDIKLNGSVMKNDLSGSESANDAKVKSKERDMKTHISQIRGVSWRDSFSVEKDKSDGERSKSKSRTPLLKEDNNALKIEDDKQAKSTKKKASTQIIDILTAKKIRDEKTSISSNTSNTTSPATSPKLIRRRLSEYVSEKLRQSSKSRSNTPASPGNKRRNGLAR